jgi:hypothetical protein
MKEEILYELLQDYSDSTTTLRLEQLANLIAAKKTRDKNIRYFSDIFSALQALLTELYPDNLTDKQIEEFNKSNSGFNMLYDTKKKVIMIERDKKWKE